MVTKQPLYQFSRDNYLFTAIAFFLLFALPEINLFLQQYFYEELSERSLILIFKHSLKTIILINSITAILALPTLFKPIQKKYFLFAFSSFAFFSFLDFIHVAWFKTHLNSGAFYALFGTNFYESFQFLSEYFNLKYPLIFIALLLFLKVLKSIFNLFYSTTNKWLILFWLIFSLSITTSFFFQNKINKNYLNAIPIYTATTSWMEYKKGIKLLENNTTPSPIKFKNSSDSPQTIVIIIGESASRHHMGLYNYKRETNPLLSKIKNDLYIFKNVITPEVHTIEALQKILTLNKNGNTIIDYFNQAGFQTTWISNQAAMGIYETPITAITKNCNKNIFINPSGGSSIYDGDLLKYYSESLEDSTPKKVIFLHLMGSHFTYENKYPIGFKTYPNATQNKPITLSQETINQYDNSIIYTDYVINKCIEKLKNNNDNSALIYFSDHGDEVYDQRDFHGHAEGLVSQYMTDIPFVLWLSKKHKTTHKNTMNWTDKELDKPFITTFLNFLLQDLTGIKTENYDSTKSLLSSFCNVKNRISAKINYNLITPQNKVLNQVESNFPKYSDKIWVHRVNSIERLKIVQKLFKGIEMDLVYNTVENVFEVRHPPVVWNGLTLKQMFDATDSIRDHYFWFDFKNLTSENKNKALKRLQTLIESKIEAENIIIESMHPKLLKDFTKAGFITSYYLPSFETLNANEINQKLNSISKNIAFSKIKALSQSNTNLGILQQQFKTSNKLLWHLKLDWTKKSDQQEASRLLQNDSTIKVLLIRYESIGYR